MPVDDLWYRAVKQPGGSRKREPSERHGRGKRWRARWVDPETGRTVTKSFERKTDAETHEASMRTDANRGTYIDPQAGKTILREYAAGWESTNVVGNAQSRIIDNALRLHVLPALGDRAVASIRRSHVQGFIKDLSKELGPGSVRNVYDVLARMLGAAVDDKVISSTPCKKIALPALPDVEVVPPTVDQVDAIAEAIPERYRAAVVLLAGSGLRIGELLGLQVSDVDFLRRTVRVDRQRLQSGRIAPPKTAKSRRTVPIGQVVTGELSAHLASFPSDEWLFLDDFERPLDYQWWKRAWKAAKPGELTTHDLRHFYASALIAGGASVKQVQAVLGHSSAVITLRVYSHLWPGDEDRTRTIVDSVLGALSVSVRDTVCTGFVPSDLGADPVAVQAG